MSEPCVACLRPVKYGVCQNPECVAHPDRYFAPERDGSSAAYEPEGNAAELERLMAVLYERGQRQADPQPVQRAIRALFHVPPVDPTPDCGCDIGCPKCDRPDHV